MSKVIVISSDATVGEDLDYLQTLPNFQRYLAGGARVTGVSSIYPSVTFPAHVTMMTGMYPCHHGVFSNMQLIPGSDPTPWQWNMDFITCGDILRAAKTQGKTTAAVFWPVTAFNPSIDYHIADYWAQGGETTENAFRRAGASEAVLEIVRCHAPLFAGAEREHPQRDEFGMACAADILRTFAPDLLMVHPANIDAARHENGVFGEPVKRALEDLDRWLGMIGQAMEETGEAYDLFLVSDHGQMDVRRNIALNVLLRENGFITTDNAERIASWQAYCLSNGMSALVFLNPAHDAQLRREVRALLDRLLEEGIYGFSRIYTEEECRREEHFGGPFDFVLETDGYTAFSDDFKRPLVRTLTNSDYRFGRATHGYLPQKGPQPMLCAKGPHIRENISLHSSHIVNEAPTYARILGIDLGPVDGHPIEDILR